MRVRIAFVALVVSAPVYAQDFGSTSGASSAINVSNPAATTSKNRLVTPPTVVAPGLAAAGIETCLGSASGGVSLMGGGVTVERGSVAGELQAGLRLKTPALEAESVAPRDIVFR